MNEKKQRYDKDAWKKGKSCINQNPPKYTKWMDRYPREDTNSFNSWWDSQDNGRKMHELDPHWG